MQRKSVFGVVISKVLGFIIFLLLLLLMNFLTAYINDPNYLSVVQFINRNIFLIIIMSLIFLIAGIFEALIFPFNLPAPIINALGSIFVIIFIGRIFSLVEQITGDSILPAFRVLSYLIFPMVFILVIVFGYISIFARLFTPAEHVKKPKEKVINIKPVKTWEDVGNEFRQLLYDFFNAIRNSINKKK